MTYMYYIECDRKNHPNFGKNTEKTKYSNKNAAIHDAKQKVSLTKEKAENDHYISCDRVEVMEYEGGNALYDVDVLGFNEDIDYAILAINYRVVKKKLKEEPQH